MSACPILLSPLHFSGLHTSVSVNERLMPYLESNRLASTITLPPVAKSSESSKGFCLNFSSNPFCSTPFILVFHSSKLKFLIFYPRLLIFTGLVFCSINVFVSASPNRSERAQNRYCSMFENFCPSTLNSQA